ncbi:hypothetical protein [Marinobacter sp. CA1]|uniref:hypothetical protein n=1 Tax=Marinobacter sp. CA1 TaxID=2817656 RepID=UPI001D06CE94|nr:hypothetical protein [Marinobacter sp. CA1]UDL04674.1 hypothetical protein J2887_18695 [Marinobacter sp. CA1]
MPAFLQQERRRHRRMPAAELTLEWRRRRGLFSRFHPAIGEDFTREGLSMVVEPDREPAPGDTLELRAALSMEAGQLDLEKILAVVKNVRRESGHCRVGLAFDFAANRTMRAESTVAQLARIEGLLARSAKLRQRLLATP